MTYAMTLCVSMLLFIIHIPQGLAQNAGANDMGLGGGAATKVDPEGSEMHNAPMNEQQGGKGSRNPPPSSSNSREQQAGEVAYPTKGEPDIPNGVIGVSLQVGAQRVGDPAVLYVAMVHPEGPAHEAGLIHGDEITTVDGAAVAGKNYDELVKMIRGTEGTIVKLGVKSEAGRREVSIPRVPSESLSRGPVQ